MTLERRKCTVYSRLTQDTLLALLDDKRGGINEVQRIEILQRNGQPDGGSFKLKFGSNITESIRFYGDAPSHTARLITRALRSYASVNTVARSAYEFEVTFAGSSGGINQPTIEVYSRNLTYQGQPAGSMRVVTEKSGGTVTSTYSFLKSIPRQNWYISSFNPATRMVCVVVNKTTGSDNLMIEIPPIYG